MLFDKAAAAATRSTTTTTTTTTSATFTVNKRQKLKVYNDV